MPLTSKLRRKREKPEDIRASFLHGMQLKAITDQRSQQQELAEVSHSVRSIRSHVTMLL